jgi:hypothetical protein
MYALMFAAQVYFILFLLTQSLGDTPNPHAMHPPKKKNQTFIVGLSQYCTGLLKD